MTLHLADSLPKEALERIISDLAESDPHRRDAEKRRRIEEYVDAGHGSCWLRRPDCAKLVQDSILHFDGVRHRTYAWVVMPNHLHALIQTLPGCSLASVVGSWKTFTANSIGRLVCSANEPRPKVWHPEFWDRFIRDEKHFSNAVEYIHYNPVKAGLAEKPEDWRWSSAYKANGGG